MMQRYLFFILLLTLSLGGVLQAQDLHFSQFSRSPMNLSPGLTGIFNGDWRGTLNYRAQWTGVPVNYRSMSAAVDHVMYIKGMRHSRFGAGVIVNYDRAGASELDNLHLALNGSYTHQLADRHFLTGGLQLGMVQRSFNTENLTWDEQYQDGRFDPNAPSGESFPDVGTGMKFDFGWGVNYRYQVPEKRTSLDVGVGIFHLAEPDISFYNQDNAPLERRFSLYATGAFWLNEDMDLLVGATWQTQGPYDQVMWGPGLRFHFNQKETREASLDVGLNYRLFDESDAFIPNIALNFRQLSVGFSYDATISDFVEANNGRGGPEFSLIYIFTKVRDVPIKLCPIL